MSLSSLCFDPLFLVLTPPLIFRGKNPKLPKCITIKRIPFGYFSHLATLLNGDLPVKRSKTQYKVSIPAPLPLRLLCGSH